METEHIHVYTERGSRKQDHPDFIYILCIHPICMKTTQFLMPLKNEEELILERAISDRVDDLIANKNAK